MQEKKKEVTCDKWCHLGSLLYFRYRFIIIPATSISLHSSFGGLDMKLQGWLNHRHFSIWGGCHAYRSFPIAQPSRGGVVRDSCVGSFRVGGVFEHEGFEVLVFL